MDMGQAEKPKAAAFLTDYILIRIYVAKYVLAGYAETYAPLLDLFRGFEKVEKKFSLFMERETAPGHGAERKFLPPQGRMGRPLFFSVFISKRFQKGRHIPLMEIRNAINGTYRAGKHFLCFFVGQRRIDFQFYRASIVYSSN